MTYRSALSKHYARLGGLRVRPGPAGRGRSHEPGSASSCPVSPAELYQVACELAQCVPLVGKAKTQATVAEEADDAYAAEAIQTLRQAVDSGFKEVEQSAPLPS